MIIKSIYIDGIQSIHQPLKIDLDPKITRIAGRNTAGKSAIVKSMSLFAGVYSRNDIPGLISWKRPKGKESVVALLLGDGTSLWARIGNTSKVQYQRRDTTGEVLRVWEAWDREIIEILGWQTVEKERLCLNIKKSKTNLFIDTAPRTNGEIIDYLCEDKDMELRIANLEEVEERLKTATKVSKTKIEFYTRKFDNKTEINVDAVERLYKKMANITYTKKVQGELSLLVNSKRLDLHREKINVFNNYLMLVNLIKKLKSKEIASEKLDQLEELKVSILAIKRITQEILITRNNSVGASITSLQENLQEFKSIDLVRTLSDNNKNQMMINSELEQITKVTNKTKELKDNKVIRDMITSKIRQTDVQIQDLILKTMALKVGSIRDINKVSKLQIEKEKNIRNIDSGYGLETILDKYLLVHNLKLLVEEKKNYRYTESLVDQAFTILEENNICPLCQSELDVDKIRGDTDV